MEETLIILAELAQLLDRYGYTERSGFVAQVAQQSGAESFWPTIAGREFWGGSGAVWEIAPFQYTHTSVETAAEDYRRFEVLMIQLSDILQSRGMSALSARNAEFFRRQLEGGA